MALDLATSKEMPVTDELSSAYLVSGTIENNQMGITVAPWKKDAWEQLRKDVTEV